MTTDCQFCSLIGDQYDAHSDFSAQPTTEGHKLHGDLRTLNILVVKFKYFQHTNVTLSCWSWPRYPKRLPKNARIIRSHQFSNILENQQLAMDITRRDLYTRALLRLDVTFIIFKCYMWSGLYITKTRLVGLDLNIIEATSLLFRNPKIRILSSS